jgi:hypothetical protein
MAYTSLSQQGGKQMQLLPDQSTPHLDAVGAASQLVARRAPAFPYAVAHATDASQRGTARAAVLAFAAEVAVAAGLAQRMACGPG